MSNFGLILGGALAGGAEGAGDATTASLKQAQQDQARADLMRQQVEMEEQKDLRIMDVKQGYDVTNAQAGYAHADKAQLNQQDFLHGEGDLSRANAVTLQGMANKTAIQAAGINAGAVLGAAQTAANASMTNAALDVAAKRTIETTPSGAVVSVGYNPKTGQSDAQPVLGSDNKPLMFAPPVSPQNKLMTEILLTTANTVYKVDPDAAAVALHNATEIAAGRTVKTPIKVMSQEQLELLQQHPEMADKLDASLGNPTGTAASTLEVLANRAKLAAGGGASAPSSATGTATAAAAAQSPEMGFAASPTTTPAYTAPAAGAPAAPYTFTAPTPAAVAAAAVRPTFSRGPQSGLINGAAQPSTATTGLEPGLPLLPGTTQNPTQVAANQPQTP